MKHAASVMLAALLAIPAVAQPEPAAEERPEKDHAWNLSLGTGGGGFVEFADAFAGGDVGPHDSSRREDRLQVNARLDREQGRMFRTGVAWVYNRWTEAFYAGDARVGAVENSVHVLLVDVTLRWLRFEHVELYSALAAGAGRWSQRGTGVGAAYDGDVTSGFAFQLRYLGLSAGGERLRAFVDLGIGFEGLVVGGLTLRF